MNNRPTPSGPIFKWWSEYRTKKGLYIVKNVHHSNGPSGQVNSPLEYQTPKVSDESDFQVSDIRMVTVHKGLDVLYFLFGPQQKFNGE